MGWIGRRAFAAMAIAGVCLASASASEPEKIDLFEAGRDGRAMYRIPGVVVTAKGTVLAYCEGRKSGSDWADIDVFLRRSEDGGRTWGPPARIAHLGPAVPPNPVAPKSRGDGARTTNNPVAVVDRSGVVHMLYGVEYARCFYMKSDDDGRTFSPPVDVTAAFEAFRPEYDWKVIAVGPGHGVQLASGRLVVSAWMSLGTGGNGHHPSVACTIVSDDAGATWRRGAIVAPATPDHHDPSEPAIVQLADGRVMLNIRNTSPALRRLATTSPDGETGWTKPTFVDDLPEPICMGSLVRLPAELGVGPDRILFAQPHKPPVAPGSTPPKGWNDRRNLAIKVSLDGGATWPLVKTLEPGPSAYSDLAVLPDGTVLCFYERSLAEGPDAKGSPYGRLTLARIPPDWLPE
ncbi:sialidase family protein [Planctomyces sp. SH-PL62]|uniref:sialidase family protein n=1 Tax=Planctomyces sp. SH-PL62 TaxID=1636152 RepID=UPI00078B2AC9|nr:sialidase family protein [Planctomyces sp. SH-PL62]AMV38202.1 Sialidase precursor [Planctomyces sp. SH-PL62]